MRDDPYHDFRIARKSARGHGFGEGVGAPGGAPCRRVRPVAVCARGGQFGTERFRKSGPVLPARDASKSTKFHQKITIPSVTDFGAIIKLMEFWIIVILIVIGYNIFKKRGQAPGTISKATVTLAKQGIGQRRAIRQFAVIEKPDIELSPEIETILNLLENTKTNVFLTGKAGTGKSTLLRYFRATTKKNVAVLAYTGVAAVNVQGQTIHSFFKWGPQINIDLVRRRFGKNAEIYKKIDTIIIDEISMVRADLFDCVDKFLRLNRRFPNLPFGGVQILAIGDLFQLPPIVKRDEERMFSKLYASPFFFDSNAYANAGFIKTELTKVHRQTDLEFIEILDAFRISAFNDSHLEKINARVIPNYEKPENEFIISLVTKNSIADAINFAELTKLPTTPKTYTGVITGQFKDQNLPTSLHLELKAGAQVMLLNNHPQGKWVNGDIVKVIKIHENSIRVLFDDGSFDDVGANKWDSIQFIFDEETNKVRSEIVGNFIQLPVRLAWAVTIHKGQGKTFDKVHIDFGDGTFAPGQAYVALSRCRTLGGMVLTAPVEAHHIFADDRVVTFMKSLDAPKR